MAMWLQFLTATSWVCETAMGPFTSGLTGGPRYSTVSSLVWPLGGQGVWLAIWTHDSGRQLTAIEVGGACAGLGGQMECKDPGLST